MDAAIASDTGSGSVNTAAEMVGASHDATKLPRALVAGGVGEAAAALCLALFRKPTGLFVRSNSLVYSYCGVLFGLAGAWTGLWVSHDPLRRRAVGMTVLWASVLPLLLLAGVGGHAILK